MRRQASQTNEPYRTAFTTLDRYTHKVATLFAPQVETFLEKNKATREIPKSKHWFAPFKNQRKKERK